VVLAYSLRGTKALYAKTVYLIFNLDASHKYGVGATARYAGKGK